MTLATTSTDQPWWKGAVIYQIYPRSFQDSNHDGIGDLNGITERLEHIARLGADAIWISPFFTSPMRDFGYDIADYCDVDPIFGTLADFDALVARAHELGLKVTIDQVYAHTSDLHDWFRDSRARRTGDKADWYVWADPKADGTPPSNWQSVFGGPAWTWDARRGQYYMHQFLSSQPQLNVHNGAVQDALLGAMRFWLDRGVDGFRLDALNHSMHDPLLRDNPPAPDTGKPRTRPFDFQTKTYSQSHPGVVDFIKRIRTLCDEYGAIFTVAEVGGDLSEREMKAYTEGEAHLNSAYGFNFLYADKLTPKLVADTVARWPDEPGMGWPSWAFENHDAPRALSRWCAPEDRDAFARMKMALLVALRGNAILYQGEELGLTQVDIPFERLQDPEAIANWPLTLSRDGARTPLPWAADATQAGFSTVDPWLPHGEDHLALAVDAQEADPASLLNHSRAMLALRRENPALRLGSLEIIVADEARLVFRRRVAEQSMLCVFNLSGEALEWPLDKAVIGMANVCINGADNGSLPPYGAVLIEESN
ncbi:alpha glucosidase (plasmid) [Sphingobium sp. V4]|uniref:alpha-glucosidase n=1 Tax=Sphingobium sp. V4 TaxID=3038927 RepID=UPI002557DF73|nr:alpha-glucosidase [Sphingobium sp. V4]WIW90670.1 alpha glucosidase [Sphingobium sp. V4]